MSLPAESLAKIVVMGTSLGGLRAVETVLGALPKHFSLPVVIVQHRVSDADGRLVELLQKHCVLPVSEPDDKDPIEAGHVYVAPPNYHLQVECVGFSLATDAPVHYARPSIDVLFETAADAFGPRVVGVLMTGASQDGAQGLARIVSRGGLAFVQDPTTAESRVMPDAGLQATKVDRVLSTSEIGRQLVTLHRQAIRDAKALYDA